MNNSFLHIHSRKGKPVVEYKDEFYTEPLLFSRTINTFSDDLLPSEASVLGGAFALSIAAALPSRNEVNRYNLSKYADQYYICLKKEESRIAFDNAFQEAIDDMLRIYANNENHIEFLARKLGYRDG